APRRRQRIRAGRHQARPEWLAARGLAGFRSLARLRIHGFRGRRRARGRGRHQGEAQPRVRRRGPMKFAEIAAAGRFVLGPVTADGAEVVAFASSFDDQWFHTDAEAAAGGPFGGLIASGWHTCALAMRLVSRELLAGSESFASPGLAYLR